MHKFRPIIHTHIVVTNVLLRGGGESLMLDDLDSLTPWHAAKVHRNTVVMGKNTAKAFNKPVPYSINFVLAHDPRDVPEGFHHLRDLDELCNFEEVHVIGGGRTIKYFLPFSNYAHIRRTASLPCKGSPFSLDIPVKGNAHWTRIHHSSHVSQTTGNLIQSLSFHQRNPLDLFFFGKDY